MAYISKGFTNGGKRPGSGRKLKRETLLKEAKKEVRDIATLEFWAELAKDEALPVLRANMALGIGDTALRAAIHVIDRALGRTKESVDITSKQQRIGLTAEETALIRRMFPNAEDNG